jgi:zinc transport system ATP-binding protein
VGLWSRRHDRLDTLSGGQQRRVLIARALSTSPDLLVMDEPTAGLDTANLQALTALLADLHNAGTTIIVVTHELTGISDLVTRAVVLRNDHHESVKYDGPPPVPADFDDDVHPHHDDPPEAPPTVGLDPS